MKEKIITFIFMSFITIMFILGIIIPDKEISYSERRILSKFPKITLKSLLDTSFKENFEKYTTDQIIFRENLKKISTDFSYKILRNIDNNGYFKKDNHIFKTLYPLNEKNIETNINKINKIINEKLTNNNVYFITVPDKNYYLNDNTYLKIDYDHFFKKIKDNIKANHIDITKELSLNDYYKTDPHWKQENLINLANYIIKGLNNDVQNINYKKITIGTLNGSYTNSNIKTSPDNLTYLENDILNTAYVNYIENNNFNKIYNIEKSKGIDPYDLFLSGANTIIEITNTNTFNNKELIIFRDSFASSLAPLLVPYYKKITLIDTRYIHPSLLNNYITFDNQDVLFIYSTLILNENILK